MNDLKPKPGLTKPTSFALELSGAWEATKISP